MIPGEICATAIIFSLGCSDRVSDIPFWLSDYKKLYKEDPLESSKRWFKDAKMGMFVHFNLASLMEYGSVDYKYWIQGEADERILKYVGISRDQYTNAKSKDSFRHTK